MGTAEKMLRFCGCQCTRNENTRIKFHASANCQPRERRITFDIGSFKRGACVSNLVALFTLYAIQIC